MRPAQGCCRHFRQANGTHLAGLHQFSQGAHTVFNRHLFVPAVQVIKVNHVSLQAAQTVFAVAPQRLWPAINDTLHAIGKLHARHAALAGQGNLLPVGLEHPANQRLVAAKTIQGGRVKQRDAGIQRGQQNTLALLRRNRLAIGMAQVHAAQTNGTDVKGADLSLLHGGMFCAVLIGLA